MGKLIERFSGLIKGAILGFDRILFKGFILPLMSPAIHGIAAKCEIAGYQDKHFREL